MTRESEGLLMSGKEPFSDREFVIEAGAALVADGDRHRIIAPAYVRVQNDKIVEVSQDILPGNSKKLEVHDQLLMPGFIASHCHVASAAPTRGIMEAHIGSYNYIRPLALADELGDDELDAVTRFNLAELLRSGCTTQFEMAQSMRQAESYVRVAGEWGARGYPSGTVPGAKRQFKLWRSSYGPPKVFSDEAFAEFEAGTLVEIEEARQFALKWNHSFDDRIRPMIGPHATDTHTPKTITAALAAAREVGNGLQIHLAQSTVEAAEVFRRWGLRPVEWLDSLGVFDVPVVGAHMSGCDLEYDPPLLAQRNFLFATSPFDLGVNGNMQPYPEMLAAGVAIGIGVDAHNMDYIETMKMAVVKGQSRHFAIAQGGVPSRRPTIDDVVFAATRAPADFLGRDDLGRIAVGAKADLVSVDVCGLLIGAGAVSPTPLVNLMYGSGLHVRNVLIDGAWMVYDGNLCCADERTVVRECGGVVKQIWAELQEEDWFDSRVPVLY